MVDLEPLKEEEDIERLRVLIEEHHLHTQSTVAKKILDAWEEMLPKFVKVYPRDYRRVLEERKKRLKDAAIGEVA
jgi:glutamate synthase domain-containing protein 3